MAQYGKTSYWDERYTKYVTHLQLAHSYTKLVITLMNSILLLKMIR